MEAPAELLAALPALATALALLLAWLLVRRGGAAASPDPAPPAQPSAAPSEAPPGPCAPEPAAAPAGPEEPVEPAAAPAQAEEQAAEARQEEEQDSESEKGLFPEGPEEEDDCRRNSWPPSSGSCGTTARRSGRCRRATCRSSCGSTTCRPAPPPQRLCVHTSVGLVLS
ncbi:matrix-remodeling-associated protein 7 isoform X5 [Oryctolagus cuniculus]|uniref:matrix-remodeling-associated protein 7 isoform X5 n=1 Tax=Oryctolagus cuniculus TaxID=9986 RepID=UPI0038793B4F